MTFEISNVKQQIYLEHTLTFESKFVMPPLDSVEFPVLTLHDNRQCILKMTIESTFTAGLQNVEISLETVKDFHFKPNEQITVYITAYNHPSPKSRCILQLFKVESKVFRGQGYSEFDSSGHKLITVCFEINIKDYFSSVVIEDFTLLLNSQQDSDFTIEARDKSFKVHKNIVTKRNQILANMIKTDMIEKQSNKIILNEWQPEIVEIFLTFLYTGTCEIENNYIELFQLAHFLQQFDLVKILDDYMQRNISLDNFVDIFEMADMYSLKDLYDAVFTFFIINETKCVKHEKFEPYLRKSIQISNIKFVLEIAENYNMKETLKYAIDFVIQNYQKIAEIPENRTFLQNKHELLFKLFEHAIDYSPDEL
ncbi:uncharacterized protein LOC131663962 [Phymastichus coffea]|uniref:uncharacterized protein LOC131663962 n=1 Tax=Phymastichus coffea TaxID=108790 RepID=UPI00273A7DD0|nr:uncharacterized protein LOC131663962 [Phymastichus coffea]